jgi:hypothetical protein
MDLVYVIVLVSYALLYRPLQKVELGVSTEDDAFSEGVDL